MIKLNNNHANQTDELHYGLCNKLHSKICKDTDDNLSILLQNELHGNIIFSVLRRNCTNIQEELSLEIENYE